MGGDSVSVFAVSADGVLSEVGSPTPSGSRPISVAFSPTGKALATANVIGSSVSVFSVSASGALTPVGSPTPTGSGARSVAFSPSGRLLSRPGFDGDF
jgi:6-phosphogluconolactonase (cycloisomerase 2 family)